jgi:energy-coupling factor transporter ATP-binding protein EcfA2
MASRNKVSLFLYLFLLLGDDNLMQKRNKTMVSAIKEDVRIQEFLDMIAPSIIKFNTDHFICGNTFRCVWALREYPTATEEQAILRYLGEKDGITLHIYTRHVTPVEEKKIISNAANKNRMKRSNTNDLQQTVTAESNLQDVANIVASMHRNKEPLLHAAVYIELSAHDLDQLKLLQTEVLTELIRSKLNVDRLMLRQQQGFICVMPSGWNMFGDQFERVLPASSVANLYPFNYSGKTDANGFYLGRDKFGSNILVDFNKRADDKTNANILILGNSGQGKSHLLKLILTNLRQSGMHVLALDPEMEYEELTLNLGGCFIDLMSGEYIINVLEPKTWDESGSPHDTEAPQTFRCTSKLSQHISFLKDFFRTYKDFNDQQIDTIEIMLGKLYSKWGITDHSNFDRLKPIDYPILSDLYDLIESEYKAFDDNKRQLYTAEILQQICLGLHSLCKGAESNFFNGHTNITSDSFVTFGVKGLLQASKNIRNALLFNVLSFMSNELLTTGNTVASIDEFYLFLTNLTAVEYVRNFMKRVRKKDSAVILASQNLEDFNIDGIREYTKPLFSIPTHQFLFNAGTIDAKFYIDTLQLEQSEYNLIRYPQRGVCLYKCGNERYNLMVQAPEHKAKLFGKAGGR